MAAVIPGLEICEVVMGESAQKQTEQSPDDKWIETARGVDSINFQRTAHITWISVLMAMVVVVLADKIYNRLGSALAQGRWYLLLFVIASGLIIIQTWVQTGWQTLISHSPITVVRTGLTLLNGLAIYFICASIENPASWFRAAGFFCIVSCFALVTGLRQKMIMVVFTKRIYLVTGVVGAYAGIAFLAAWHLTVQPVAWVAWFWGAIAILMMTVYLWLQSRSMKIERKARNIP